MLSLAFDALRCADGFRRVPGAALKHRSVVAFAKLCGTKTFVEAGTWHGDGAAYAARHFERVWTVELDAALAAQAQHRFDGNKRVKVVHGDAADEVPRIVRNAQRPFVFLDGHYSGPGTGGPPNGDSAAGTIRRLVGSPVVGLIVDDWRLYGTLYGPDQPTLLRLVREAFPRAVIDIHLDQLRAVLPGGPQ